MLSNILADPSIFVGGIKNARVVVLEHVSSDTASAICIASTCTTVYRARLAVVG